MERVALGVSLCSLLLGQLIALGGVGSLVVTIVTAAVLSMTLLVVAWLVLVLGRDMVRAARNQKLATNMMSVFKKNVSMKCV